MSALPKPALERPFLTLEDIDAKGKVVLVRADLNVPMKHGRISDETRLRRLLPTLHTLLKQRAKVVVMSHFDRPKGTFVPSMSLAPLADALSQLLDGHEVKFCGDCIGSYAKAAVAALAPGDILLLENLRFYPGEESNDADFASQLAELGEIYVNDAFSCSHRAHASIVGLAERLPAAAGLLMQEELDALSAILEHPKKPVAAVVGGSKISSKLQLLENLIQKVDVLVIGGGMANTFLYAQGHDIGDSLCEKDLKAIAQGILAAAANHGCEIVLPVDVVTASSLSPQAVCTIATPGHIAPGQKILDVGPRTIAHILSKLDTCQTIVWNGPVGAFETSPFDASTITIARIVASLTASGKVTSIAGGGDTVAALTHAGVATGFSYMSTAGGAFLEWLEGHVLPGVEALYKK